MIMQNKIFLNADISDYEANEKLASAVQDCMDCQEVCLQTVSYCLSMSDSYPVRTLLDCIEICQVNADFLLRGSKLRKDVAEVCASACDRAAEFCKQFDNDAQMSFCAELCKKCADSSREIAKIETNMFLS